MSEPIKHIWTTRSRYVDEETGEEITKYQMGGDYKIIKKKKYVTTDENSGKKYVEVINTCRKHRYKQQRIDFGKTD